MRFVVLLLIAACGRLDFDGRAVPEVPTRGPIDVFVSSHLMPTVAVVANAPVWSTTPDGDVDSVAVTDATGHATLDVEPGDTVSAFDAGSMWLTTFVEVEPLDTLHAGLTFPICDLEQSTGSVTMTWEPFAGATEYRVIAGCASGTSTTNDLTIGIDTSVREPFDVVLGAYSGDTLIATATKPAAAFHDGVRHTFVLADWRPAITATVGFTNIPEGEAEIRLGFSTAGANVPNAGAVVQSAPSVPLGQLLVTTGIAADATRVAVIATSNLTTDGGTVFARPDGPIGIVPASKAPPLPSLAAWDAATRKLTWSLETSSVTDSFDALVGFTNAEANLVLIWSVRAPAGARSAVVPAAPVEIPDLSAVTTPEYYLIANNFDDAQTYREARQLGEGGESVFSLVGSPALPTHAGAFTARLNPMVTARQSVASQKSTSAWTIDDRSSPIPPFTAHR